MYVNIELILWHNIFWRPQAINNKTFKTDAPIIFDKNLYIYVNQSQFALITRRYRQAYAHSNLIYFSLDLLSMESEQVNQLIWLQNAFK